jgi:glycosyltransferase involved in cell wall biosynthesis
MELKVSGEPPVISQTDIKPRSHSTKNMAGSISSVVHVASWLSRQGGGIPPVVWALSRAMNLRGVNTSVVGLKDEWVESDCADDNLPFTTGKVVGPKAFGFSTDLSSHLCTRVQPQGIIHNHGLWMYPGLAARRCADKIGVPLVISPHGMLEPWALKNSRWKKQLAGRLFENKNLRKAGCLHALCLQEADNFRRYGLENPIAIISNGVDLDQLRPLPDRDAITEHFPKMKGRRRILFLSRLHPKKGLANLLQAWRNLESSFADWCLLIAGSGQPVYEEQLRTLVKNSALEKSVFFLGPEYGNEKREALAAADVFVLPSYSEGFSMAVLEAAAAGLPVMLTRECNFPELGKAGAGVETTTDCEGIESGLRQILKLSDGQRSDMGRRGMELVQRSHTWPVIAGQMIEVYQWLAGNGPMPKVVKMD